MGWRTLSEIIQVPGKANATLSGGGVVRCFLQNLKRKIPLHINLHFVASVHVSHSHRFGTLLEEGPEEWTQGRRVFRTAHAFTGQSPVDPCEFHGLCLLRLSKSETTSSSSWSIAGYQALC